MKNTELRLGNWVEQPNTGPQQVTRIWNDIQIETTSGHTDKYCRPILLTEEWILRLGFKWDSTIRYKTRHQRPDGMYLTSKAIGFGLRLNEVDKDYEIWLLNCDYIPSFMPCFVKHVHSLQNKYFEFTDGGILIAKKELV